MACRISFRGRQVLDFVAQHLHAPVERGFVDGLDHLGVDDVALFKGLVELQLADHTAQRGLRQLGDGHDVVAGAVAGAHGVGHLKVQDAVHLQLGVVAGDADLAGHVERDFLEAVLDRPRLSTNGTRKFRPGVRVPAYLPSRSLTQAFCCGTTLTERAIKMTAMIKMTMAISMDAPFGCDVKNRG
jgi:hypothetical protein